MGAAHPAWRFLELRDDDFVGGLVLRHFERFASTEVRTWWIDGVCVLVGPHPDSPNDPAPVEVDLAPVAPLVGGLGLPFVTVDLALREDGVWRVIELGDGQVSDRPNTIASQTMIDILLAGPLIGYSPERPLSPPIKHHTPPDREDPSRAAQPRDGTHRKSLHRGAVVARAIPPVGCRSRT
ncbi:ATP-grasp domain-containing protein [Micromonospora chokoriensis]